MKPHVLYEFLNFGYTCQALRVSTSSDYTQSGYNADNIARDFSKWRSQGTDDVDIYTQIYEAQAINCCVLGLTNISSRSTVVLSGSNASGVGGFNDPLFQVGLKYSKGNWVLLDDTLPACKYFRITISDPAPTAQHFEINKLFLGITLELPFDIVDGWIDSNESFQKRELNNGQWNQGTLDSLLKVINIPFRSASGLVPSDQTKIQTMKDFINIVRTTRPFFFILNPDKPELYCQYMTINSDQIDIDRDEAERYTFNLEFKETR